MSLKLAELFVYPVKGARGIALDRADVLVTGLRHDRRFMVLGANGRFITQRSHPRLALIGTELAPSALTLSSPAGGTVTIALPPVASADADAIAASAGRKKVRVFADEVEAAEVPGPVADLFSDHLGERCTLVFMPDDVVRPVEAPYGRAGDRVAFADAYPVLLATRASLADLNSRLAEPVPMNRFRPNFVIEGGAAFEEEQYSHVRVGALEFRMPKRCARCQVTLVDQASAIPGKEPLRTLAEYRTSNNKVYFAQNLIPNAEGAVAIGDEVTYFSPSGSSHDN
jgi:uncharacterized protein